MENILYGNCLTCHKELVIKKNYPKRFCDPACGFKANEFWSTATPKQIIERWRIYFEKNVIKKDGCWDWNGSLRDGYGVLAKGKNSLIGSHRVSYILHNGEIPSQMLVLHSCDNRKCTNPDHLRLGTHSDNNQDMRNRKRAKYVSGENQGSSKLTYNDVVGIKEYLKNKKHGDFAQLSRRFNVSIITISRIYKDKTWRGVPWPNPH